MRPLSKAPASYVTSLFIFTQLHWYAFVYQKKKKKHFSELLGSCLCYTEALALYHKQNTLEVHNISLDKKMENDQILTYNKVPTPQNCGLYKYHTLYPHLKDLLPSYSHWCNRQCGTLKHLLFVSVVKKSIWIALHIWEDRHCNWLVTMTNYKE